MPTSLERAAAALAEVSPAERRAVLEAAERLHREQCCASLDLHETVDADLAARAAEIAKALSDPLRVQMFDLVRRNGVEICQCDLQPLFEVSQSTLSHHLRKLVDAGLMDVERRGKWAYYSARADSLEEMRTWLTAG